MQLQLTNKTFKKKISHKDMNEINLKFKELN